MVKQVKLSMYERVVIECVRDWLLWVILKSEGRYEETPRDCLVSCVAYLNDAEVEQCLEIARKLLRGSRGPYPYTITIEVKNIIPRFLKILNKLQEVIE